MDHCTFFPDCCVALCCARHDRRYENKRLTKYQADKLMYRCAKQRFKESFMQWSGAKAKYLQYDLIGEVLGSVIGALMFMGVNTPIGFWLHHKAKKKGKR